MPPADLTRFDFHVVRFVNSYDVEIMTDAEIGQYVLLLCKAWLLAREATLPNDDEYLARAAHTAKVSERVLAKFPLVETEFGTVRRNKVLFEEWQRASERSEVGRELADRRWNKGDKKGPALVLTANTKAHADASTNASPSVTAPLMPKPYQADSNQTKPNQPNLSAGECYDHESESNPASGSDWGNLRRSYRKFFSKKPDKSRFGRKYDESCDTYGEPIVLACFEQWAGSVGDVVKSFDHPLHSFFKKLSDLAADELESQKEEQIIAEHKKQEEQIRESEQVAVEESVAQQKREYNERMDAVTVAPNEASALDYLAEMGYTPEEIEAERLKIEKRN